MKLVTYFILIVLFAFPSTVLGKETLPILKARCHMDVCHWWRIKEVRDSRFPDRPDIGWNPEKRILKNQLANPFFLLRKKPFVVNLLFDHGYTYHRCSDGYKDEIISCSEFGPQNDEYPSNWEEDPGRLLILLSSFKNMLTGSQRKYLFTAPSSFQQLNMVVII